MSVSTFSHLRGQLGHSPQVQRFQAWRRRLRLAAAADNRFISLKPAGPSRGSVLLSFINAPFFRKPGEPISNAHTHYWEAWQMAQTYLEMGFTVDVINYLNSDFVPRKRYAVLIDARDNLERLSQYVDASCIKILHADTAHWVYHNLAGAQRLHALQQRRHVVLSPRRYTRPNWAIENADCATVLGNEFTLATYRYAGKPLYRIPISTAVDQPWSSDKDFEAVRRHYLWFGSAGFVHKGLDVVLEAFAAMPDFHLTVCGPIEAEKDFIAAYRRELYETANIHTQGWVDVDGPEFAAIARSCLGLVYPSCSEGGGASVLTCMHAGLVPLVTYQTSVDVPPGAGTLLPDSAVETIQAHVQSLSAQPAEALQKMAYQAWDFVRTHHSRATFAENYRRFAVQVVERSLVSLPAARGGAGLKSTARQT